jgi:hypothetical protein
MQLTCQTCFSAFPLELLPFSIPSFLGAGVFCPRRIKTFIDHAGNELWLVGDEVTRRGFFALLSTLNSLSRRSAAKADQLFLASTATSAHTRSHANRG